MGNFLTTNGGVIFTVIGAVIAVLVAGLGSAKSTAMVGKAAAGLITEEPEKFGKALLLQLLPGTQGLYGFIIGFIIALKLNDPITLTQGLYLMAAALPVGVVGYLSAIFQGNVSVAGIQILAKNPEHSTKGVIFAAIVEMYAILAFVTSIILVVVIYK